jgi:hypothetical protein
MQAGPSLLVVRGLDQRTYPFRCRNAIGAPLRVDPRIECADDEATGTA